MEEFKIRGGAEDYPYIVEFFDTDKNCILAIKTDGDILLHGKLIENDKQVVEGLRAFLRAQGLMPLED